MIFEKPNSLTASALSCLMRTTSGMMAATNSIAARISPSRGPAWMLLIGWLLLPQPGNAGAGKIAIVPQWSRFEQTFRSSVDYANPLQECTLRVSLISPGKRTNEIEGFWDGGRTWRFRFAPDEPGPWTYRTSATDTANRGLHQQGGAFVCTAAEGDNRFGRHGPIRVARSGRHFEHADGTPFFWISDVTWHGPRLANAKDWELYAGVRANQKFTAVQWRAAPDPDSHGQTAFTGELRIAVNPAFFQRLDSRIDTLSAAGLLSVIMPSWDVGAQPGQASDPDQMALLVRYMMARWGANPVAWLVAGEDSLRWKRIGRASLRHAPGALVVVSGPAHSRVFEEFREEGWVDAFTISASGDSRSIHATLPNVARVWSQKPARPVVNAMAPMENSGAADRSRINAGDIRAALWPSLLHAPPAGIDYCAEGVIGWDASPEPLTKGGLPLWHRSLFLPGARQMAQVALFAPDLNQLRPAPELLLITTDFPPDSQAAAVNDSTGLAVIYVSSERILELPGKALPLLPAIHWLNPRTGEQLAAVALLGPEKCQFPAPGPGDWILVVRAGKAPR